MPPNNQANPLQQPASSSPIVDSLYSSQQPPLAANQTASQQNPPLQQSLDDKNKKPAVKQSSTQNSLLLSELRDSMVIMNDGTFRAVVACKSINFDLMSSRERDGVELSYQDFLNALYFPIQVFIRSQQVDIGPYIDKLTLLRRDEDNMLLGVLMEDYINFIDMLSQEANIMDKSFFVVIPYYPTGDISEILDQSKGFFSSIFGKKKDPVTKIDKETYKKAKEEIKNRVDSVVSGLIRVGVQTSRLNTKQLGELYYNIYNPDTAVREPLGDFNTVASLYVRKGDKSESVQGAQF